MTTIKSTLLALAMVMLMSVSATAASTTLSNKFYIDLTDESGANPYGAKLVIRNSAEGVAYSNENIYELDFAQKVYNSGNRFIVKLKNDTGEAGSAYLYLLMYDPVNDGTLHQYWVKGDRSLTTNLLSPGFTATKTKYASIAVGETVGVFDFEVSSIFESQYPISLMAFMENESGELIGFDYVNVYVNPKLEFFMLMPDF